MDLGYARAIGLNLALNSVVTLGYTLQRKSHVDQAKTHCRHRPAFTRPLWVIGLTLYVLASLCVAVIDLGNLPFFVVIPLKSSNLVYNLILCQWILNERVSIDIVLGTILVAFGAITVGVFGYLPEPDPRDARDFIDTIIKPRFIIYETALVTACIVAMYWRRNFSRYHSGVTYACIGTVIASQSALNAKAGISLLRRTIDGVNQFHEPLTFVILTLMIVLPVGGLWFINKSLETVTTSVSVPVTFCLGTILAVMNTWLYYDDIQVPWWKAAVICFAVMYIMCGAVHVHRKHK